MRKIVSLSILLLGATGLGGCGAERVTAVDETQSLVSEGEPVPNDPWGVCNVDWECSDPDGHCMGWVEPRTCDADEECEVERVIVGCIHPTCETNSDCPVPLSGDAEPVCAAPWDTCYLSCDEGKACPNGYECIATEPNPDGSRDYPAHMCMQIYGPEASAPSPMPVED